MILASIAVGTLCLLPLYVIYFVQIKKRENPDNPSPSLTLSILTLIIGIALVFMFIRALKVESDYPAGGEYLSKTFLVCAIVHFVFFGLWLKEIRKNSDK
jgi:cytochrome c biogenesis protein CcdA